MLPKIQSKHLWRQMIPYNTFARQLNPIRQDSISKLKLLKQFLEEDNPHCGKALKMQFQDLKLKLSKAKTFWKNKYKVKLKDAQEIKKNEEEKVHESQRSSFRKKRVNEGGNFKISELLSHRSEQKKTFSSVFVSTKMKENIRNNKIA